LIQRNTSRGRISDFSKCLNRRSCRLFPIPPNILNHLSKANLRSEVGSTQNKRTGYTTDPLEADVVNGGTALSHSRSIVLGGAGNVETDAVDAFDLVDDAGWRAEALQRCGATLSLLVTDGGWVAQRNRKTPHVSGGVLLTWSASKRICRAMSRAWVSTPSSPLDRSNSA